jgi:hypothetical protein
VGGTPTAEAHPAHKRLVQLGSSQRNVPFVGENGASCPTRGAIWSMGGSHRAVWGSHVNGGCAHATNRDKVAQRQHSSKERPRLACCTDSHHASQDTHLALVKAPWCMHLHTQNSPRLTALAPHASLH